MGLLFGSAGAHTYPKSGQIAPPPPARQIVYRRTWHKQGPFVLFENENDVTLRGHTIFMSYTGPVPVCSTRQELFSLEKRD